MTVAEKEAQPKDSANKVPDPCTIVIFGATGDLTKRLLMPALCNLAASKLLPKEFAIIGTGRNEMTDEAFRSRMTEDIKEFAKNVDSKLWQWFLDRLYYVTAKFDCPNGCDALKSRFAEITEKHKTKDNGIFYMAVPPDSVPEILQHLAQVDLIDQAADFWRRIVVEKPFGRDLKSAKSLNQALLAVVKENQIFRIDHFLGKESVQNIMVFRFANGIFEPIWNNKYIDNIQITAAESLGIEGRGAYYDNNGALRDMIQNHLFQMLALVTMDAPKRYDSNDVRDRKRDIFTSIRQYKATDIANTAVRGQYAEGKIAEKTVCAYREEDSVKKDSQAETYAALKVLIDTERWSGVPFYLRTGKRLSKRVTEIVVQFKNDRMTDFGETAEKKLAPNTLVLKIQPEEGICLEFGAKVPGEVLEMQMLVMDCEYSDYFGKQATNGYETLIYDCLLGNCLLFARADNVETNWSTVDPILKFWQDSNSGDIQTYASGTSGPIDAEKLLERDGRKWRQL